MTDAEKVAYLIQLYHGLNDRVRVLEGRKKKEWFVKRILRVWLEKEDAGK